MKKSMTLMGLLVVFSLACNKQGELLTTNNPANASNLTISDNQKSPPNQDGQFSFNFKPDFDGWVPGFSEYPVGAEQQFQLGAEHVQIPEKISPGDFCVELTGFNQSDDLFMFLKRKLTGLQPNTKYDVAFDLEMVSEYPENSIGIGGSPGSSVYVKVGAVPFEPFSFPDPSNAGYFMNIDKGNQASDGTEMITIGNIGIQSTDFEYTIIHRDNSDKPFSVTTDANGDVWVIIGTDSGFEGKTAIYYNEVSVSMTPIGL